MRDYLLYGESVDRVREISCELNVLTSDQIKTGRLSASLNMSHTTFLLATLLEISGAILILIKFTVRIAPLSDGAPDAAP